LSNIYSIDWGAAKTNIVIDLIARVARGVVSINVVGPLVLLLALLLPPLGVATLGRRVFGHLSWWHIAIFVFAFGGVFAMGFINFAISLGVALLAAALEGSPLLTRPAIAFAIRLCLSALLLVCHPFGLLFYAVLLGGLGLGTDVARWFGWRTVGRIIAHVLPPFVALAIFQLLSRHVPGSQVTASPPIEWQSYRLGEIASMLATPFKTYNARIDAVFMVLLGLPIAVALARGRLRVHPGLLAAAALLMVGALIIPTKMLATAALETRLPTMMWLTLAAAVLPVFEFRRAGAVLASLALLLVVCRSAWVGEIWYKRQADLRAIDKVIALVPPGTAVLPVMVKPADSALHKAPIGRYMGTRTAAYPAEAALAVTDRQAFMPYLFSAAGKQPLSVLGPWRKIATQQSPVLPVETLSDAGALAQLPYLHDWRNCFDFVLLLNADMSRADGPAIPGVALMADDGFARLYRVEGHSVPGVANRRCVGQLP
jgi:hypothetical protein